MKASPPRFNRPGTVGYVEYGYATQNSLPVAALENLVITLPQSQLLELEAVELPADDLIAFITDPAGELPIVTYTWLLA